MKCSKATKRRLTILSQRCDETRELLSVARAEACDAQQAVERFICYDSPQYLGTDDYRSLIASRRRMHYALKIIRVCKRELRILRTYFNEIAEAAGEPLMT